MQIDVFRFLSRLAGAYNVCATRVTPPFDGLENFDYGLRKMVDPEFDWKAFGQALLDCTPSDTLLIAEGTFELHFALFRLPEEKDTVYLIGPWCSGPRSEESRRWIRTFLGEDGDRMVQEYYNGVRVLKDGDLITSIFCVLSEAAAGKELKLQEIQEFRPFVFRPDIRRFSSPEFEQEIPYAMIEQRYQHENALLDAVSKGDEVTALTVMQQWSRFNMGNRFVGSLYREKSRLIILNTLLRKAIERSSIHPYYIDQISSMYARRIEDLSDASGEEIIALMIRDYCAYVRRYSLRQYSPTVQKAINYINLNISEPHTLKSLASCCGISPSYLSSLFKQETGSTLIDYINTERVRRSAHLLESTSRSVSDIAAEVGILDVNYFARVFKKVYGITPTRYRRQQKKK